MHIIYFSLFSSSLINLYILIIHNACSTSQFLYTLKHHHDHHVIFMCCLGVIIYSKLCLFLVFCIKLPFYCFIDYNDFD